MSATTSFKDLLSAAESALQQMVESHKRQQPPIDSSKWLEVLFKHYTDRMLSDNERIWRTGALFVPVSLAAFGALSSLPSITIWHVLVLGVPSSGLMLAWIVIAENHRAFQQKSEAWLVAIQEAIDLKAPRTVKVEAGRREAWVTKPGAIQTMRWYLLYGVVLAWVSIGVLVARGTIPLHWK